MCRSSRLPPRVSGMESVREFEATSDHIQRAVRKGTTEEQRCHAIELLKNVRRNLLEFNL